MTNVLLVEDDRAIADPLVRALAREGYAVSQADTGESALRQMAHGLDLVILDLGLPDIDGLDVARKTRQLGFEFPILILTARAEEVDMVVGLDAGADDYVTKPFRLAELLARVRALLRRGGGKSPSDKPLAAQDVQVDPQAHRVFVGEKEIRLTGKEFDLLAALLRSAGEAVPRDRLLREVWGSEKDIATKKLDMHISWLRRKLGDDVAKPHYITTVRGLGFRFEV
ncbi:response regulator transcription factor [Arcanobacterium sp. S3PF19]|uniref:response regulator transcription factor n=1 Tax=Arcanobacterium sp. S3PF19 TaxID=1219585 RepID=UPI00050FC604|nr:response regulator transcription factor [Arcanobacterium sp. S3PF19]KGF05909.1 chemotaxis protein CheY [Arcanobacterium sp. S3PF19]